MEYQKSGIHDLVKKKYFGMTALIVIMGLLLYGCPSDDPISSHPQGPGDVPVKGMVTMVDLGADACIPCKMMAPIITKLENAYRGKAAIVFIDVWKDKAAANRFGIRAIPTQIFFDKSGKEVYRHTGFLGEADIISRLKEMGVS